MDFSSINFLAVAVSTLAAWILGSLWYSPILFGKTWQKLQGFTDEYIKEGNMAMIFGSSFIMMLIMALGLAMLLSGHSGLESTWQSGLTHGLYMGLLFTATSMAINYLYQRRSIKLWLIDAGYQVLFLGLMGTIIGAWH